MRSSYCVAIALLAHGATCLSIAAAPQLRTPYTAASSSSTRHVRAPPPRAAPPRNAAGSPQHLGCNFVFGRPTPAASSAPSLRREPPRKVGPREAAALRHVERVRRREERRQRAAALFPGDVATVGSPTESVGRGGGIGGRGIDLEPSLGAGGVGSLGLLD